MKTFAGFASLLLLAAGLSAAETKLADFTGEHRWGGPHHMKDLCASGEGLAFTVTDEDPWLVSPPIQLPPAPDGSRELAFTVTCAPTREAANWQLFYGVNGRGFTEVDSALLQPVGRAPYTKFRAQGPLPPHFHGTARFRLDPPGGTNTYTVTSLSVDYVKPLWTYQPTPPAPLALPDETALVLTGTTWEVRHDPSRLGAFRYTSHGKTVENNACEPFVYLDKTGTVQTLDWSTVKLRVSHLANSVPRGFTTYGEAIDADGRRWSLKRTFTVHPDGKLRVATQISVDGDTPAQILHVPALTLFVDRASGGRKHQALLAGVEYLADEPSSNDKEIRTPEHNRQIVDATCLSAPFAAFTDERHWFAANWAQFDLNAMHGRTPRVASPFAVVFDTPDRLLQSGGHLLAFWAPAVGPARHPNARDIYQPTAFREACQIVEFSAGDGADIATVLAALVPPNELALLPPPDTVDREAALETFARGWLDSQIRDGLLFRHAINGGSFPAGKAADAPCLMRTLAAQVKDGALAARLRKTADETLAQIAPQDVAHLGVSHVRRPAPVLVAGDVPLFLDQQAGTLSRLAAALADGSRTWHKPAKGRDLGETLGDTHCNGYTAMEADQLLAAATWSGDEAAIEKALAVVDQLTARYHGTVPRGAQPWEMPLHTPDIMASAHLTRIYTLAYLLRPDAKYLTEARHWAYTGLAFVYLVPPTYPTAAAQDPVGAYATCAVMGATNWVAPNWIGRPVQWCGLVYSAALYDLARIDPTHGKLWHKVAVGITHSGVRQTYTAQDDPRYVGLLPDSWNLAKQDRYWCPINPGTVQENYLEAIDAPFYSVRALPGTDATKPALLHVAGSAEALPPTANGRRAKIACWSEAPSTAVVTRCEKPAAVTLDNKPVPFTYNAQHRAILLTLPARATGDLVIK